MKKWQKHKKTQYTREPNFNFNCLPGVSWLLVFCGSSSRCREFVCDCGIFWSYSLTLQRLNARGVSTRYWSHKQRGSVSGLISKNVQYLVQAPPALVHAPYLLGMLAIMRRITFLGIRYHVRSFILSFGHHARPNHDTATAHILRFLTVAG